MANDPNHASGSGSAKLRVLHLDVGGMHCVNCAELIEQRVGAPAEGAQRKRRSPLLPRHSDVHGRPRPCRSAEAVADDGYTLSVANGIRPLALLGGTNTPRDYLEIAAAFAILAGLVLVLQQVSLLPRGISVLPGP